jgi:two-component system OmpR family sensor kinase
MSSLSLRARLLLGVVALALLGLAAADIATYKSLQSFLLQRVDSTLAADHHAAEHPDSDIPPNDYIQKQTLDGTVLFSAGPRQIPGTTPPPPPKLPSTIGGFHREGPDLVRYLTVPATSGGGHWRVRASVDGGSPDLLIIATSLGDTYGTLHRLLLIELLVTAAVLAALAVLALWIVRLGLRPLREIEVAAAAITAGDLSRRVEHADERTEVGRVGAALNTMLDRIEASDRRLRRFIADASHELRTPLAAVRAYAELFDRGAATRPQDLERSMSGITRESERMSLLVDDLLLLARLDEGRPLEQKPVDLAQVVGEAVDAARVVEPERPIELSVEPVTVTGDEARLRQVLDNLFANARSHTPAGTPVSVALERVDGHASLSIADHGPGLSEDEAARVFERFYRADASRARASGGVGLGLSIVAAVTEAHGGTAEAKPTPGGGATFVVTLPLAPAPTPSGSRSAG